jgi:hypothetical protein
LVQAILAVVFFAGIFFVITFVLKLIGSIVTKKIAVFDVEHKGLKWGGLGVRAVDAVLYTILLLLPLYGTIGAYAPTAQSVLSLVGGEETAVISQYLNAVTKHPMVAVTGNSLFGGVYNGLMDSSGTTKPDGSANVNIGEMVETMDKTMVKFDKLQNATTPEEMKEATVDLTKLKCIGGESVEAGLSAEEYADKYIKGELYSFLFKPYETAGLAMKAGDYLDIAYIAFFETEADAALFTFKK